MHLLLLHFVIRLFLVINVPCTTGVGYLFGGLGKQESRQKEKRERGREGCAEKTPKKNDVRISCYISCLFLVLYHVIWGGFGP